MITLLLYFSKEINAMFKILVAEDDTELRKLFCTVLKNNSYDTFEASNGEEALDIIDKEYIDLIISDIMMPKMDGYELTKQLREAGIDTPILMVTAKDGIFYKREGFSSGTDDYMVKPVDVNELIWRVQALLRRSKSIHERKLTIGSTTLECDSYTISCNGESTVLPPKEFNLLYKLASAPNRTFTRVQIMDEIWGLDSESTPHTLEVHIGRLREHLKDNPDIEIVTVRNLGYKVKTK